MLVEAELVRILLVGHDCSSDDIGVYFDQVVVAKVLDESVSNLSVRVEYQHPTLVLLPGWRVVLS